MMHGVGINEFHTIAEPDLQCDVEVRQEPGEGWRARTTSLGDCMGMQLWFDRPAAPFGVFAICAWYPSDR